MGQVKLGSLLYTIVIDEQPLLCLVSPRGTPIAIFKKEHYKTLRGLLIAIPHVANSKLGILAMLVNFFYGKGDYLFLENISKFQEDYLARIEFEKNSIDYIPDRLIDHGVFDVQGMHTPRVIEHQLVFFVQHQKSLLPYKVACPYPIPHGEMEVSYQLLPYASP